jgi:hypothetical protein
LNSRLVLVLPTIAATVPVNQALSIVGMCVPGPDSRCDLQPAATEKIARGLKQAGAQSTIVQRRVEVVPASLRIRTLWLSVHDYKKTGVALTSGDPTVALIYKTQVSQCAPSAHISVFGIALHAEPKA